MHGRGGIGEADVREGAQPSSTAKQTSTAKPVQPSATSTSSTSSTGTTRRGRPPGPGSDAQAHPQQQQQQHPRSSPPPQSDAHDPALADDTSKPSARAITPTPTPPLSTTSSTSPPSSSTPAPVLASTKKTRAGGGGGGGGGATRSKPSVAHSTPVPAAAATPAVVPRADTATLDRGVLHSDGADTELESRESAHDHTADAHARDDHDHDHNARDGDESHMEPMALGIPLWFFCKLGTMQKQATHLYGKAKHATPVPVQRMINRVERVVKSVTAPVVVLAKPYVDPLMRKIHGAPSVDQPGEHKREGRSGEYKHSDEAIVPRVWFDTVNRIIGKAPTTGGEVFTEAVQVYNAAVEAFSQLSSSTTEIPKGEKLKEFIKKMQIPLKRIQASLNVEQLRGPLRDFLHRAQASGVNVMSLKASYMPRVALGHIIDSAQARANWAGNKIDFLWKQLLAVVQMVFDRALPPPSAEAGSRSE